MCASRQLALHRENKCSLLVDAPAETLVASKRELHELATFSFPALAPDACFLIRGGHLSRQIRTIVQETAPVDRGKLGLIDKTKKANTRSNSEFCRFGFELRAK